MLKVQEIVRFVRRLDSLEIVVADSKELSTAMKQSGINMRYLGKIIKLTKLPYVRMMAEIEAVARVVRNLYREHQREFTTEHFRTRFDIAPLIEEAFSSRVNVSMRRIRVKQLRQEEDKCSRLNAVDFLNLMFGTSAEFWPFWSIVRDKVR
jgi:hypothetical protein